MCPDYRLQKALLAVFFGIGFENNQKRALSPTLSRETGEGAFRWLKYIQRQSLTPLHTPVLSPPPGERARERGGAAVR